MKKISKVFEWEFAQADAVIKFMFSEAQREANAVGAKGEREP